MLWQYCLAWRGLAPIANMWRNDMWRTTPLPSF
jgi:hypothetical protein